jgi:ADP-heptose:LPS heptosyltransferase
MNTLIIKLGATGDVVRTTPIIKKLNGQITWITASKNVALLQFGEENLRCISWENRDLIPDIEYDLVINLEDTLEVGSYLETVKSKQRFGAYVGANDALCYTDDSRGWFDLSLISRYGREEADRLKLLNRRTYQDLLFASLGYSFSGETYLLPTSLETGLAGDVAISAEAGPVWPMKNWAYYAELKRELEASGLTVNVLGKRASLLEHLCDVRNHRCLVGGDSLPMHLALGTGTRCVTIFNCTSPWEIHDYGIQRKIISPLLAQFFYQRNFDPRATTAVGLDDVLNRVMSQLEAPVAASRPLTAEG